MLLHLLPLIASMLLSLAVGIYIIPRKETGVKAFAFVAFSQAGIIALYILELISPTLGGKVFWDDMQYVPYFVVGAMYLVFGITYATGPLHRPKRAAIALSIVPLIALTLIALDPYTGLYRPGGAFLVPGDPFDVLLYDFSPLAWLLTLYVNLQVFAAIIYIMLKLFNLSPTYRFFTGVIAFSMLLPMLSQFVGFLGLTAQRDLAPYAFGMANLLIGYALLRGKLINLNPIAHSVAFENMRDVNLIFNAEWHLVDYNRVAANLLTKAAPNPLGMPIDDLCRDYTDQIEELKQLADDDTATPFVITDGRQQHIELFVSPIRVRGKTMGYSVMMHDISDRVRLEQERAGMLDHLDSYAHSVAHDIKNPLNTLMWGIYELTHADENNLSLERRADILAALEYTTNKALEITESMLRLGSIQHNADIHTTPVPLRKCIEEAVGRLDHDVQALNGQIIIQDGDWPEVLGYPSWVEQACHNLIHNALKYGGIPPVIEISWVRTAGGIRCNIKDNGPGLADDLKVTVFAPFKRFSERPVMGQGLGLAIVKRVMDRLGGQVGVDDADGGGAIFWLELPEAGKAPKARPFVAGH